MRFQSCSFPRTPRRGRRTSSATAAFSFRRLRLPDRRDVLAAWGLYVFLRPVDEAFSKLVAWFRVAFATLGVAALLNLVTAYRLVTRPATLVAIGQHQIDLQVYAAISSFNVQFAFLLIFFGVYLVLLGWLAFRASYFPRWLAVLLVLAGVAWILRDSGPYLMPGANLEFLLIPTFAELFLLVWMIGWGTRVKLPEGGEAISAASMP